MKTILLLLMAASSWAATTAVTETVVNPDGTPASGTVYIRVSASCQSGSNYVDAATIAVPFTNGAFTANLVPNDTCVPSGTSYSVLWKLAGGRTWTETWVVPTSTTAVTVQSVAQLGSIPAPSGLLPLSQFAQGGAQTGQYLGWSGSVWAPTTAAIGPVGPQGTPGLTGLAGIQGLQGLTGPTGSSGTQGLQGPAGPTGPQGPASSNATLGACSAGGATLSDMTCPGSLGSGDPTTSGALDLKGKTSGNTVTIQAGDSTAAYTEVLPAAAPAANQVKVVSGVAGGVATDGWLNFFGAGTAFGTFDPARITAGDCAKFDTAAATLFTVISTPCPTNNALAGGTANEYAYWTGPAGLTAEPHMMHVAGIDSPELSDSGGALLYMYKHGGGPATSELVYDGHATTADQTELTFIGKSVIPMRFVDWGSGWQLSGVTINGLPSFNGNTNGGYLAGSTTSLTTTTLTTGQSLATVHYYADAVSGAGSVTITLGWMDQRGAKTFTTASLSGPATTFKALSR